MSTGVNRYMRDAKAKCIAEGASEMHYAIIANQLFHGVGSSGSAGIGRELNDMSEALHQQIHQRRSCRPCAVARYWTGTVLISGIGQVNM